jgi:hypothetical protein
LRKQRLAKREIEVNRPGVLAQGSPVCLHEHFAEYGESFFILIGERGLEEGSAEATEKIDLVDGLPGCAVLKLGWAIGGKQKKRCG